VAVRLESTTTSAIATWFNRQLANSNQQVDWHLVKQLRYVENKSDYRSWSTD